jgi:glycosidase
MADYNLKNTDFRIWYKQSMMRYITEFKADGFRLDGPNGVQPYNEVMRLWDEIVTECGKLGYPVLVFPENWFYHFQQGLDETVFGFVGEKQFNSIPRFKCRAISNHDYGIENAFPETFYQLKGSRCKLAYEYIFKYDIPLLMSGEEFNADFVPLPNVSTNLYGGGETCSWLYASWMQWEQIHEPDKKAMLDDFKRILKIRKQNNDILNYDRLKTNFLEPYYESESEMVPQPYIRYIKNKAAIIIAGNYSSINQLAIIKIEYSHIAPNKKSVIITNLKTKEEEHIKICGEDFLFKVAIPADKTSEGGYSVYRFNFNA